MTFEDEYQKKMIKQKEDYEKQKKIEGDSDLIFNEKDNKQPKRKFQRYLKIMNTNRGKIRENYDIIL